MELRKLEAADLDELLRVVRESLAHLRPWMPWPHIDYDAETAADFLTMAVSCWERGTMFHHAITVDGAIVGVITADRAMPRPRPPRGLTTTTPGPHGVVPEVRTP